MSKECLMGLRMCDSEPMQRDDGWLEVGFVVGVDPELVNYFSQRDMSPQDFVLAFLTDAIDCFKIYLSMDDTDEDKSNV